MTPDDLQPLEDLLRRQPLRAPCDRLDLRVAEARRTASAARRRWAAGAAGLAVAAAAGLAFALFYHPAESTPGEDPASVVAAPVQIEQVWATVAAGEVERSAEGAPLQRIECEVVRHVQWIDDQRHVRIEWNIPSRESRLVPLEYN